MWNNNDLFWIYDWQSILIESDDVRAMCDEDILKIEVMRIKSAMAERLSRQCDPRHREDDCRRDAFNGMEFDNICLILCKELWRMKTAEAHGFSV